MSIKLMNAVWDSDFGSATKKLVMLSLADNANDQGECWPSLSTIAQRTGLHRVTVTNAIKNLVSDGVLKKENGGGHKSSHYTVLVVAERYTFTDSTSSARLPQGKRTTTTVVAEDYPSGSGALPKPSRTTIEPPVNPSLGDSEQASKAVEVEMISKIYQAYPRKVGKPAAIKAIIRAIKKHPAGMVLERTMAYAKARQGQDENFTPHPATWFNQERFLDDPSTWAKSGSEKGGDRDWGW